MKIIYSYIFYFPYLFNSVNMRAFLTLLLVAVAYAELAPLVENVEPIPGKYIIKLKVHNQII